MLSWCHDISSWYLMWCFCCSVLWWKSASLCVSLRPRESDVLPNPSLSRHRGSFTDRLPLQRVDHWRPYLRTATWQHNYDVTMTWFINSCARIFRTMPMYHHIPNPFCHHSLLNSQGNSVSRQTGTWCSLQAVVMSCHVWTETEHGTV